MKIYLTIEVEKRKQVCTVWLNRPTMHNAMDDIMIAELTDVFRSFFTEEDLRLVILRGRGKSFCAGADLKYMKTIANFGPEENLRDSIKLAQLFSTIYECMVPTIAVAHGACFGGANGLLAACDIAIAEENTVFAFSEVKLGIAPATIAPFIIRRIGEYGAKELMMTGKRFKAQEAKKWNLLNHALPENELEEELENLKKQILSSAPNAVRATKELISHVIHEQHDMVETSFYTTKLISELRASEEGQEGMAAFLEKRKPKWIIE